MAPYRHKSRSPEMDLLLLKRLYESGVNILDHLEQLGVPRSEAIEVSYDLQAGSYVKYAEANKPYTDAYAAEIAAELNGLSASGESVMEAGVGEATTLANVRTRLDFEPHSIGFDISLSRILFARQYFRSQGKGSARFFVGDIFHIPFPDNSIDIVFTSHSLEPNGGREREGLSELYRVTGKYLILFEPSYELATTEGKTRMDRLGYIKRLPDFANELGMRVLDYRLTRVCDNPLNPTAMLLIEKDRNASSSRHVQYCCPATGTPLKFGHGCYWSESSLRVYPVVFDVPLFTKKHGIVATHFPEFAGDLSRD